MTDNPIQSWPCVQEPGKPLDHSVTRPLHWHWLRHCHERVPQPVEWCPGFASWWLGPDEDRGQGWRSAQDVGRTYHYLGPVLSHEENVSRDARIAQLEQELSFYTTKTDNQLGSTLPTNHGEHVHD